MTTQAGSWWSAYRAYLQTDAWRALRAQVLARDRECTLCGGMDALHVHHLTYERVGREALADLTVCCSGCHYGLHAPDSGGGTGQTFGGYSSKAAVAHVR